MKSSETIPPLPPLVTLGDPRLARRSAEVDPARIVTPEFRERVATLHRAMVEYQGIGIAAPQIGWFERVFVMMLPAPAGPDGPADPELLVWINPEIVTVSPERNWAWEGCLSVPGLRGWIRRPAAIAVKGINARGEAVAREFTHWPARVFQHEFDHVEGLLFPYRALDPRHVVATDELLRRDSWPDDWPAPGARSAPYGAVVPE